MLRPCNLIQKYLTETIKNATHLPTAATTERTVASAAGTTASINTTSGGAQGMREVRALSKNKSAVSSLSFSTSEGSSSFGDDEDITKENTGGHSPALTQYNNLHKLPSSSGTSTLLKTSKSCEGRLMARVLPKHYAEYDSHKPATQIDPTLNIKSLMEWQKVHDISNEVGSEEVGGASIHSSPQVEEASLCQEDDNEVVVLDLYLLRRSFFDEQASASNDQTTKSLIRSYDLSRNSSHARISTQESCSVDINSAIQTDDSFSDNIFHFHMNRSSNELMSRTLRRLELSATRKLQSLHPLSRMRKKSNRGKEANLAMINKVTSSKLLLLSDETKVGKSTVDDAGDDWNGYTCSEVDLTGLSSADILRSVSSTSHDGYRLGVALTIPTVILPWSVQETVEQEELADSASTSTDETSSVSSIGFNELETIFLSITSNPPTVLEARTFENFTARVFVGVPLVVETTIIYATKAIITWFVDSQVVAHDSKSYSPSADDIGKRISILITPIRPGHNGEACQEAYTFVNLVEPLPTMPIMELREEWSRIGNGDNSLRILTYNILADLYAGRQLDQQLLYSHCEMKDLLRSRRMPMIIAEILSYKADIICLQEVDAAIHDSLLGPVLTASGYQGFYSNKVTCQQEGCSMFWSTSVFEMAKAEDMKEFPLRSLLTEDAAATLDESEYYNAECTTQDLQLERWESMTGIRQLLESHDEVRRVYSESVGQILQVATLSPKQITLCKPERIVVANTHLFYHPMAGHIRLLQAYAVCNKLDQIRRQDTDEPSPLLICGDFNSDPLSGAVRLLTNRSVLPQDNDCWKHLNRYTWECGDSEYMLDHGYIGNFDPDDDVLSCCIEEDFVDAHSDEASLLSSISSGGNADDENSSADVYPPAIFLPSCFPNLVSGCLEVPPFTNYATDFIETLDYVFASGPSPQEPYGFRPKGEAPMPSEDLVKRYVAMPNEVMPSDHVALVCDFEWVKKE